MSTYQPDRGLDALTERVGRELDMITNFPGLDWVPPTTGPDGRRALDVLVVGAGHCGLATGFQLWREQVRNFLIIDKAPDGKEGPWRTFARMHTLRTPKNVTGPDLDIPSLTYQAWHEAQWGVQAWADLGYIPKENWAAYLAWYRRVIGLPVRNETALKAFEPAGDLLKITVEGPAGEEVLYARALVLATGIDGTGRWWMPDFVEALPEGRRFHSAEMIDFAPMKGKRVAVLGAGASAFDNAAVALETGAAEVTLYVRRDQPQLVQPYRWLSFNGFLRHLGELDDTTRWRFMRYILNLREGFTDFTYERCAIHPNFRMELGAGWQDARIDGDVIRIATAKGEVEADYVICGTGPLEDLASRPELAPHADRIALWRDRYTAPEGQGDARLERFPYLGPNHEFLEKRPGEAPWLHRVRCFSLGATMSFGPSGASVNGMKFAVPRMVAGITRQLLREDAERQWDSLMAYDTKLFDRAEVDARIAARRAAAE